MRERVVTFMKIGVTALFVRVARSQQSHYTNGRILVRIDRKSHTEKARRIEKKKENKLR